MSRIAAAFFFAGLILGQISLAGHLEIIEPENEEAALPAVQAPVTLEALVSGRIRLQAVFGRCPSIEELKINYIQRSDISDTEKRKFLQRSRTKIDRLLKLESKLDKAFRRQNPVIAPTFKNFRGDVEQAQNANDEQLRGYNFVLRALKGEHSRGAISKEIFKGALYNLASLRHLHLNNRQISLELARSGTSDTYGRRPALHFQDRDRNFELKANDLFGILMRAFIFANNHGLLPEAFDVLANGNGCLEARYRGLYNWYRNKNLMNKLEAENQEPTTLTEKAEDAVYIWLAENSEHLNSIPQNKGPARKGLVQRICRSFSGCKGSDGKSITPNFVLRLLEDILYLTPDSSFDSPEASHE